MTTYNLLERAWLPVSSKNRPCTMIAPWQITDEDLVRMCSPRPDFDGALLEFLIGLVQTIMPPESQEQWATLLTSPPSPEELRERFEPWSHAFELLGDGPLFYQDLDPELQGKTLESGALLIGHPTGNTLKRNADFFAKRASIEMSPAAAAAALVTLQTYASQGGAGHRTSVRGGGPLTTLLVGETLWQTIWLNVLPWSALERTWGSAAEPPTPETALPWMQPTRTSEKQSPTLTTTPEDVHPIQVLWGMPRRVRLGPWNTQLVTCTLYGHSDITLLEPEFGDISCHQQQNLCGCGVGWSKMEVDGHRGLIEPDMPM